MRCLTAPLTSALGVVLLVAPSAAVAAEPFDAKQIDEVMQEALRYWKVPGAALAIVRGRPRRST